MRRKNKSCTQVDLGQEYSDLIIRKDWTRITFIEIDYTGHTKVVDLMSIEAIELAIAELTSALDEYIDD